MSFDKYIVTLSQSKYVIFQSPPNPGSLTPLCFCFCFSSHICGIWKFPSQGWNPRWSCDLLHSCATPGIEPVPPLRQAGSLIPHTAVGTPRAIFFFFFCLFRAAPVAYGVSQARGQTGAIAAGLHHTHSNIGSKPHLVINAPTCSNTGSLTY